MNRILFISILVFIFGCQNQNNIEKNIKLDDNFIYTLNKFKLLDLNFKLDSDCFLPEEECKFCNRIDTEKDLPFFHNKESMATSIGLLPDTSKYYMFLYCEAAECYVPSLAVFSKKGKLIDDKSINYINGAGCGFKNSNLVSVKGNNIIQSFYLEESYECDSLANPIPGTWVKFQEEYNYEITESGKIIVSKERKTIFKK